MTIPPYGPAPVLARPQAARLQRSACLAGRLPENRQELDATSEIAVPAQLSSCAGTAILLEKFYGPSVFLRRFVRPRREAMNAFRADLKSGKSARLLSTWLYCDLPGLERKRIPEEQKD